MVNIKAIGLILVCLASGAQARDFQITGLPKGWQARITIAQCEGEQCSGKGQISLTGHAVQQTFDREDLSFYVPNLTAQQTTLTYQNSPLTLTDFNFDGTLDLAIDRGHEGPYGSMAYDIYVQTLKGKWVYSQELSELTDQFMGLPEVNAKRKTLTTWAKSGCCYHVSSTWRVIPQRGLQEIAQTTWDATQSGEYVVITERKWVNGKWHTKTRRERHSQ